MKNLTLFILIMAVLVSFGCSADNKSSSNKNGSTNTNGSNNEKTYQDEWTTMDYHYRTGSVGPEYYYHYRILLNKDKTGQLIFYPTAADTGFSLQSFTISDSQLSSLNDAVKSSKVMSVTIPEATDHPIGGSTETLMVTIVNPDPDLDQSPRVINIPAFPEEQYKAGVENLYNAIRNSLPTGMLQGEIDKR